MTQTKHNRDHDGFLKYVYSVPENVRGLFRITSKTNKNLAEMLSEVDLNTLEEIPEAYNEVQERGEADVAFKVMSNSGEEVFFGILLEHKSYPDDDVFLQVCRYTFKVVVNKSNKIFPWMPTKAVIIYNGSKNWDPLAKLREKPMAKFHGKLLPFECVFVNLAEIDDEACFADANVTAAIGALAMKYAFNMKKFEELVPRMCEKLKGLDREKAACLVSKIELYFRESINRESLEEMKMAVKSLGQLYGFVSIADDNRAKDRKIRRLESANAAKDREIEAKAAAIEANAATIEAQAREIAALKAQLLAKN